MRILLGAIFSLPPLVQAHSVVQEETLTFFERFFSYDPLMVVGVATTVIFFVVVVLLLKKFTDGRIKIFFFVFLTFVIASTTVYISGETFYTITTSETKGPVHWHADFRIFQCGEEIDLIDPQGFSNRVGDSLIHEHGDNRVHIEGTLASREDAALHNFIEKIGGTFTDSELIIPTNAGVVRMKNGELCPDGATGQLQVFLWKTEFGRVAQSKLEDFSEYIISPEELIPPGDCIIFEFDGAKEQTKNICEQYEVAQKRGDVIIER